MVAVAPAVTSAGSAPIEAFPLPTRRAVAAFARPDLACLARQVVHGRPTASTAPPLGALPHALDLVRVELPRLGVVHERDHGRGQSPAQPDEVPPFVVGLDARP